ncbi:MAG: putative toxin-antitoxin system toxin component, PIN family [Oxalobacteraceae bacterium]|nr:putative toxin-antitoxin system toxin component, PIN family [Oxalobacteraceae bacterium]
MIPKSPARLVLDTNVCLDLFVYRDQRWQRLLQSMENGEVTCITREDCRTEWTLVLEYPRFSLDDRARQCALDEFDRLIAIIDTDQPTGMTLPICKDRDDQKFLELAATSSAHYLVSKDKALLKLARRVRKLGLFEIITPEQWVARYETAAGPIA